MGWPYCWHWWWRWDACWLVFLYIIFFYLLSFVFPIMSHGLSPGRAWAGPRLCKRLGLQYLQAWALRSRALAGAFRPSWAGTTLGRIGYFRHHGCQIEEWGMQGVILVEQGYVNITRMTNSSVYMIFPHSTVLILHSGFIFFFTKIVGCPKFFSRPMARLTNQDPVEEHGLCYGVKYKQVWDKPKPINTNPKTQITYSNSMRGDF